MRLKTFANKVKDSALQLVAKWIANRYHLQQLGRITDLRFDSSAQQIFLVLDLHGESEPVELRVHYCVPSPTVLEIVEVHTSRQWMTAFINEVIPAEQKPLAVALAVARTLSTSMK